MTYIAIAGFIFVFALSAFGFNYRINSINRIYFGLYKGLVESCVITVDDEGRDLDKPVFCRTILLRRLEDYLERNNAPMGKTNYYLLTYDDRKEIANVEYATTAVINLFFELSFSKEYHKIAIFTIQDGELEAE